jgi:hypothetical protein
MRPFSDAVAMRSPTTAALLLLLAGCGDQVYESYATYAEAQRAGAIERGWVPAFVPASARAISDSHNLDTNRQTLRFTIPPAQLKAMVTGLRLISAQDTKAAAELSRANGRAPGAATYVVCSENQNGALAVDHTSGRAVYDTTVEWADDDCSE